MNFSAGESRSDWNKISNVRVFIIFDRNFVVFLVLEFQGPKKTDISFH